MAQNEKELMSVSALTRELHMRTVRNLYDQYLEQAKAEGWDYEKFLRSLLQGRVRAEATEQPAEKAGRRQASHSINIWKTLTAMNCRKASSPDSQNSEP